MKSLKLTAILAVIAIILYGLFGVNTASAQKSMTLKMGHGHSILHPDHLGLVKFKELLQTRTNGRIKVEIFPSAQLGSEQEMCEQAKIGTITGLIGARFEEMSPKLYATSLPFLFRDYGHTEKVLKGPIGNYYASFTEEHDLKMLAWTHSGFRQITNNVRPISKPEDLKGIKIRTPPLENVLKTMEAFGASPTPIPYAEVYTALKTGVVDGQENPYVNIFTGKFYEVQKYLSEVNYIYIASPFIVGLKWWKSLTPQDQVIINTAALEAADLVNQLVRTEDLKAKETIVKSGVKINELTSAERSAFIAKVNPVYDYFIKKGIVTEKTIKEIQNIQ